MRVSIATFLSSISLISVSAVAGEQKIPLKDGEYIFEHKYTEAEQHNIKSISLIVTIMGYHIVVTNRVRFDVFPEGVVEEGTLMWHSKSGQWIIGTSAPDKDADEAGGCTDGPTVIDLEKRIYWTC
jgi:hypothetical protein